MATNLRYRINPAERRLDTIDKLEAELKAAYAAGEYSPVEYREHLYTLSLKRQSAYKALQRSKPWPVDLDPTPEPITPETVLEAPEPPRCDKPPLKQRLVGAVVLFGFIYGASYLIQFIKWASSGG